ncbi:MAG: hypothetical protein WCC95_22450 [Candidatus Sulfotelmatobacter sp.]
MKKASGLLFVVFVVYLVPTRAQDTPQWELYGAYQYLRTLPPKDAGPAENLNGWNVSLQENKASWWGGVADFSGSYGTQSIDLTQSFQSAGLVPPGTTVTERSKPELYTFAGGPQFTYRAHKVQPFARIMAGAALVRQGSELFYNSALISSSPAGNQTAFALIAGGCADYVWKKYLSFRAAGDLVRTFFSDNPQNNIRISIGVNFRIGQL